MEYVVGYFGVGFLLAISAGLANGDLWDDLLWRLLIVVSWPLLVLFVIAGIKQ